MKSSFISKSKYYFSSHNVKINLPVQVTKTRLLLTLSTFQSQVVLLNSPNLCPYFSLNKFERILLLIFSSFLCLINSQFLITKCLILYLLCKEKLSVDNWLGLKGLSYTTGLLYPVSCIIMYLRLSISAGDWRYRWLFKHFCWLEIGRDKWKKLLVVIAKMQ